ncbi:MAG: hypothetical protein M3Q91_19135, partial [Acidobacteriota bacterium]|nr:hypothetical protein [Acidobacteriota bacterium]
TCKDVVEKKIATCQVTVHVPELMPDWAAYRPAARAYLDCVEPHFFCNGIEVRTEGEARDTCNEA